MPDQPGTDLELANSGMTGEVVPMSLEGATQSSIQIGKKTHDILVVPACNTCRSSYRPRIEVWFIQGLRPPKIHKQMLALPDRNPDDPIPSVQSIRRHFTERHSTAEAEFNQRLLDAVAAETGKAIDEEVEQQISTLALSRKVVDIVGKKIYAGEIEPSDTVLQLAWKTVERVDSMSASGSLDVDAYRRVIDVLLAIGSANARDKAAFADDLRMNPILREFERMLRGESEASATG